MVCKRLLGYLEVCWGLPMSGGGLLWSAEVFWGLFRSAVVWLGLLGSAKAC